MTDIEKRIKAFVELGDFLKGLKPGAKNSQAVSKDIFYEDFEDLIKKAHQYNGWFTEENIRNAIVSISGMLSEKELREWIRKYKIPDNKKAKRVGVIMAGNVPLVGFHDMLCVLISGNIFIGKLSNDDRFLLPKLAKILTNIEPDFKDKIIFTLKLENIDAVIATGSNNTSRYFEYYFGKYPHIIRKNRNSIAVLTGKETNEELNALGKDIFQYFGLGCRNVSKLFVPEGYDLDKFFTGIFDYKNIVNHNKYGNNYDYNKTVYMLGGAKLIENGFVVLKEDKRFSSPVAVLFYEYYKNEKELAERLKAGKENIQCIVGNNSLATVNFGEAQCPTLNDYADDVDTMKFLLSLDTFSLVEGRGEA